MAEIIAEVPIDQLPSWAVWERRLFDALDQSVYPFLAHFARDNGEFIWQDEWSGGSCDDFYEPFFNWPLVYLMGGGDHLLGLAERQWEAITGQLTRLGAVHKEYGVKEDNFHQSESDIFFYNLCLADPDQDKRRQRAQRFAGFYLNEDRSAVNYDPEHKIVRSPYNGSRGAFFKPLAAREKAKYAPLGTSMGRYGLPFFDLPGIESVQDLGDPAKARAMGQAMFDRHSRGDVAANMSITSLVTNAFLMTGAEKYRDWVVEYTEAWIKRGEDNGGFVPDNVGLGGQVGEYTDGKWYGGLYGWTWPHGFRNLSKAFLDAGANAFLLTRDERYLALPRRQIELILALGEMRDMDGARTFVVPMRYGDAGWFDWGPVSPAWLVALWNLSMAAADWQRIEAIRAKSADDWNQVAAAHNKEDAGHERPWVRFLAGANPDYPQRILHGTHQIAGRRLAQIREDTSAGTRHHVHHWQWANPVSSEALVQLTLGAPQQIYNGGLLHARLRYFDAQRRRPGLPEDVGALVEKLERDRTVVRLVNLNLSQGRRLVLQAGTYGEHRFGTARFRARVSDWPGGLSGYAGTSAAPAVETEERRVEVDSRHLWVELPPGMELVLELGTERYVNEPSYHCGPF